MEEDIVVRIACCEDEKAQAEEIKSLLEEWAVSAGQECSVTLFSGAEQFLFELEEESAVPYDLVLLDILMGELDGFSLAKKLRGRDSGVRLAFLTSDPSHVFEGYELKIWRYLLKPLTAEKTKELMSALLSETETASKPYVFLEIAGENKKLYLDDILYVEVNGHYTTIRCAKPLTAKTSFSDMLEALNAAGNSERPPFIKCHRSAAVNIAKVVAIRRDTCLLENGEELAVSRGMYRPLNEAFIRENA